MTVYLPEGFEEIPFCGPSLRSSGYVEKQTFLNMNAVVSQKMLDIGNLAYLWHGTGFTNVLGITSIGLKTSRGGLLGPGIYFAPGHQKSANHMGKQGYGTTSTRRKKGRYRFRRRYDTNSDFYQYANYGMLLKCKVALGMVYHAGGPADHKINMITSNCQSVYMGPGTYTGWAALREAEYCVYDPEQVIIEEIHIYFKRGVPSEDFTPMFVKPTGLKGVKFVPPKHALYTPTPPAPSTTSPTLPSVHPCNNSTYGCIWATNIGHKYGRTPQTPSCAKFLLKGLRSPAMNDNTPKFCKYYQQKS